MAFALVHFLNIYHFLRNWSTENDHELILTHEQRAQFRKRILEYRSKKPIYLVHSPGDEEYFGGCVSAGRAFAHVTPYGDLTPCPASDIATHNLTRSSLRDALASRLFHEIRENEHLLETGETPCALFAHPKEVDELAKAVGAYRTGSEQ
jgi:MoaA/NifB/PqqE/SkfB family radical SAM enzyme